MNKFRPIIPELGVRHGTIAQFVAERLAASPNPEQLEAFAREFYGIVLRVVNDREHAFSLQSQLNFPRVPEPEQIDFAAFKSWVFDYFQWFASLFEFEADVLNCVRITWS
jgi:hypothetical protein